MNFDENVIGCEVVDGEEGVDHVRVAGTGRAEICGNSTTAERREAAQCGPQCPATEFTGIQRAAARPLNWSRSK